MSIRRLKFIFVILSVAALITLCLYPLWNGNGSLRYDELILNAQEMKSIMSVRQSDQSVMTDIFFDDQKLIFDERNNTIYYSLIEGDKKAYDPKVSVGSLDDNVSLGFLEKLITAEGIASNTKIETIVYDDFRYYVCDLVCTTLPLISIECKTDVAETETSMLMTLFDNGKDSSARVISSEGMIRTRGATSMRYSKKSYKLSLRDGEKNRNLSLLGMRQDDDWILYSCYADPERVRNVFSQNLWTDSCGTDNVYNLGTGSYYKYVELFLNGEYYGLYALGYKTDVKTLGIEKFGSDEGLFQKTEYELSEFKSDEPLDIIQDFCLSLEEHHDDKEYLMNSIDLDNATDFFLYTTFIQGWDNILKNYMILLKHFHDGKKAIYIPWDMDLSWGNMWNENCNNWISSYELRPGYNVFPYNSIVSQLLLNNDEEVYSFLHSKYLYNRSHGWSDESIDALLDELEDQLFSSGAYFRDVERWPESANLDDVRSLDKFRSYVHERLHEMDDFVERLCSNHSSNPLITQLQNYKDLSGYRFIIVTKYPELLNDPVYSEFIDRVGKDKVTITGDLNFNEHRVINVHTSGTEEREIMVFASNGQSLDMLNPDDFCRFRIEGSKLTTLHQWMRCLDNVYGIILLQINDWNSLDVDKEHFLEEFDVDCGSYNSVQEIVENNNSLVFMLNCDSKRGYFIEDAYSSGTQVSTELGDWAYYEGEDNFGIYINGEESIVDTLSSKLEYNIRITEFSRDWKEIICDYSE